MVLGGKHRKEGGRKEEAFLTERLPQNTTCTLVSHKIKQSTAYVYRVFNLELLELSYPEVCCTFTDRTHCLLLTLVFVSSNAADLIVWSSNKIHSEDGERIWLCVQVIRDLVKTVNEDFHVLLKAPSVLVRKQWSTTKCTICTELLQLTSFIHSVTELVTHFARLSNNFFPVEIN